MATKITTEKILVLLRSDGENYPPEVYPLSKLPELLEAWLGEEDEQAMQERSVLEMFDMWEETLNDDPPEDSMELWLMLGEDGMQVEGTQHFGVMPLTLVEVKEYFGN